MWSFLELAARLRGKVIIRMNLWHPEDVQGTAQSETGPEFSLGLAHSSSLELLFLRSCRWEQLQEGGKSFITAPVSLIWTCLHRRLLWGRSCFSSLRKATYFLIYQRRLKQREHSAALLKNSIGIRSAAPNPGDLLGSHFHLQ